MALTDVACQRCVSPTCGETYGIEEVHAACPKCGDLLDIVYDWVRARPPSSCVTLRRSGRGGMTRCVSAASGDSTNCCRLSPANAASRWAKARRCCSASDPVGRYVGMKPGRLFSAVRGDEPVGQLQGQRHDGRLHACPIDRRDAARPAPRRATPARRWRCTARSRD